MTDFISQTKIPAVFLAKAMMNKSNFDNLLHHDAEFKENLSKVGYAVQLSPASHAAISSSLDLELESAKKLKEKITHKAEVFADVLSKILIKMAEKSPHDTQIIYNLSQIIFLWDEFIDFEDYQKTQGDLNKIRESAFYKGAFIMMETIPESEVVNLAKLDIQTQLFKKAFYKLQILNSEIRFGTDKAYVIIDVLKKIGLSSAEIVFFLLIIESALFIRVSELLLAKVEKKEVEIFLKVQDLNEAIDNVKVLFHLDPDELENILEQEARTIVIHSTLDILS